MASGKIFRIVNLVAILFTSLSDQDLQAVELNSPDQTLRLTLKTNPDQQLLGSNVTEDEFIARNQHPMVLGSRCHHLAMYVVYENPVPMVCDAPSAYIDQPGFDWIQRLPTEWDETRYLAGEVGKFLVIARRKNADWFLGAMTNASRHQVPIELSFLSQPSYSATRWQDVSSTDPKALRKTEFKVRPNDTLELDLLSNGGQTLWFTPTSAP